MSDASLPPKAYRLKQAAELLSLPYSTLYDLVRRGEIASIRIGTGARKIVLIPSHAIDDLLSRTDSEPRRARGCPPLLQPRVVGAKIRSGPRGSRPSEDSSDAGTST